MITLIRHLSTLILLFSLMSCGSDNAIGASQNGASQNPAQPSNDIAGLWNISEDIDGVRQTQYLHIFPDGNAYIYALNGNCYEGSGTFFENLGNNTYRPVSALSGSNETYDPFTATALNNQLVIQAGQTTIQAPRVNGVSPAYIECEGQTVAYDGNLLLVFPGAVTGPVPAPPSAVGSGETPIVASSNTVWTNDSSLIAGVWDASSEENGLVNIFYTVIDSNGVWTDFDYLGDSFDSGPDCYEVEQATVTHDGNNNYQLNYASGEQLVFSASIINNELTVSSPQITQTVRYPRINGIDESVPNCP